MALQSLVSRMIPCPQFGFLVGGELLGVSGLRKGYAIGLSWGGSGRLDTVWGRDVIIWFTSDLVHTFFLNSDLVGSY